MVPIFPFHCNTEGTYQLKLTVEKGAPKLAGVPHALVVRYEICGMEYLIANIACLIGIFGCVIAGILAMSVILITLAKRRKNAKTAADREPVSQGMP